MDVKMTISLGKVVTGQQIMDALGEIAGKNLVKEPHVLNDKITYTIGRSSKDEAEDALVQPADGSVIIDPARVYSYLVVEHHPWPGEKYADSIYLDGVVRAMKILRKQLKDKLES